MERLSKSQLDKLGKRLAAASEPPQEDLALLQAFRAAHDASLQVTVAELAAIGFEATPRLKTPTTIIDKLVREKTRLSGMQDIAGARVVVDATLNGQDESVRLIVDKLGGKVVDRRQRPTHGYRAVHVVSVVGGFLVEIQVRTPLQNLWAQMMERVGDRLGRGVRYGDLPDDPLQRETVTALIGLAGDIAKHEEVLAKVEWWLAEARKLDRAVLGDATELVRVEREMAALKQKLDANELSFRETLGSIVAALEGDELS